MATQKKAAKALQPYLTPLTPKQRMFVQGVLNGLSDMAAATAAGMADPNRNASRVRKYPAVKEAIEKGIELAAEAVMFTRAEAHQMYMDAHANAANTMEQVAAIREMVKLHGIAAPEVKEIHTHGKVEIEHREVKELTDAQLLELAQLEAGEQPAILEAEYHEVRTGEGGGPQSSEGSNSPAQEESETEEVGENDPGES